MNEGYVRVTLRETTHAELAARGDAGLSNAEAEQLAEIMQGLSSPLRLRLLSVLRAQPRTVTELSDLLDAGQTTVSNHLRVLRHLSLVSGSRDGRHVYYALFDDHVSELLEEAIGHLAHLAPAE